MAKYVRGKISLASAANAFGVHQNTIHAWFKRGCPRSSIEEIFRWKQNNLEFRTRRRGQERSLEEVLAIHEGRPAPDVTKPSAFPPAPGASPNPPARAADAPSLFELREARDSVTVDKGREQVRKLRLQNDIAEGRVIDRAEAERFLSEMAIEVRSHFEQLPERMRMVFPPEFREELVAETRANVDDILRRIAGWRMKFEATLKEVPEGESDDVEE